jgi:hypothetical protein
MLAALWCFLFGHRYEVWQNFSRTSRRVVCGHCHGDWAMNDEVRAFVPWSGEFAAMYELFGHRIRERPAGRRSAESK